MSQEWRSTLYVVAPHPTSARVLLQQQNGRYRLPATTAAGNVWDTGPAAVEPILRDLMGQDLTVLHRLHYQADEARRTGSSVYLVETAGNHLTGQWVDASILADLPLDQPEQRSLLATVLEERVSGPPSGRNPWARPGWQAQVEAWIEAHLSENGARLLGPLKPVKRWALSCVLEAPTSTGSIYFKTHADLPLFGNEAAVLDELSRRYPTEIPRPLALERRRIWMLLPPFEEIVGWDASLAQRRALLTRFARLQRRAVSDVEPLLRSGCLDRRLDWTAAQIEPLLDQADQFVDAASAARLHALAPLLRRAIDALQRLGVPETLVHGDLHGGNVALRGGQPLYFDWTDACISHPFVDLLDVYLEEDEALGQILRDAYLAEWADEVDFLDLQAAWPWAEAVAALHHTISYVSIVQHVEPGSAYEIDWGPPFWFKRLLSLLEKLT
ncbi:MAG: aminoglycoside phosphotransferase family protein [Candidatus Promineifilaceae bacterium]|nr:aminoglycoside phosphotransferase family protein [Candidatus Promineifilaceae bacterium]